jgi:hypothetical protein
MRQWLDGDLQPPLTGTLSHTGPSESGSDSDGTESRVRAESEARAWPGPQGQERLSFPGSQPSLSWALLHGPQDAMKSESSSVCTGSPQVQGQQHMADADSEGRGVAPGGRPLPVHGASRLGPTRPPGSPWLLTVVPSLCSRPGPNPAGRSVPGRKIKIEKQWL